MSYLTDGGQFNRPLDNDTSLLYRFLDYPQKWGKPQALCCKFLQINYFLAIYFNDLQRR